MADKKISALTAATTPLAGTEVLPIVQSGATVKVANNDLRPKQIQSNSTSGVLQVTGPAAASTRVMTTPDANFSTARIDAAQAFVGNQTLTDGNLVIGTSGKGIDFSADGQAAGMTSELLDDYEEGTWTPTQGGGLTVVGAYSSQGFYTKIGREVTLYGSVSGSTSVAVNSASDMVGAIPFTPAISTSGSMNSEDGTKTGTVYMGGSTINSASAISATSKITFTITYFV